MIATLVLWGYLLPSPDAPEPKVSHRTHEMEVPDRTKCLMKIYAASSSGLRAEESRSSAFENQRNPVNSPYEQQTSYRGESEDLKIQDIMPDLKVCEGRTLGDHYLGQTAAKKRRIETQL